jgi:hypothetical protein
MFFSLEENPYFFIESTKYLTLFRDMLYLLSKFLGQSLKSRGVFYTET